MGPRMLYHILILHRKENFTFILISYFCFEISLQTQTWEESRLRYKTWIWTKFHVSLTIVTKRTYLISERHIFCNYKVRAYENKSLAFVKKQNSLTRAKWGIEDERGRCNGKITVQQSMLKCLALFWEFTECVFSWSCVRSSSGFVLSFFAFFQPSKWSEFIPKISCILSRMNTEQNHDVGTKCKHNNETSYKWQPLPHTTWQAEMFLFCVSPPPTHTHKYFYFVFHNLLITSKELHHMT